MKRLLLLLPVLALTLTACTDAPSGPSQTARTPIAPSLAVTQNGWFDVSVDWFNICGPTPEMVSIRGRLHQVVTQKGDESEFRVNAAALTGVGQTTGNTYVAKFQQDNVVVFDPGWSSQTLEIRIRMISKGSADNFIYVFHSSFTVSPPSATSWSTIECEG